MMKEIYTYWIAHQDDEGPYYDSMWKAERALKERLIEIDCYNDEKSYVAGLNDQWGLRSSILHSNCNTEPPMQPLELDGDGRVVFKENPIVKFLLDAGPFDLGQLRLMPNLPIWAMEQFYQLIGYSVDGFGEISIFRKEIKDAADFAAGKFLDDSNIDKGDK